MKKYILSILALALGMTQMSAQTLTIDNIELPQGGQVTVPVKFETGGKAIVGCQFKLTLPEGISTDKTAAGVTRSTLSGAYSELFSATGDETGFISIMPTAKSSKLSEESGTWFTFTIKDDSNSEIDKIYTVNVTNVTMSQNVGTDDNPNAQTINVDNFDFTVKIVENVTILDENSTTAPEAAENVNVLVKRSIKAGNWSTICLPFAMTEAQVKEAFGEEAELADFTGFTISERDADNLIMAISVNFASATSIQANHPYLLKSTKEISYDEGFKVENVTINPKPSARVQMDFDDENDVYQTWFSGTYIPLVLTNNNWFFLSGNKFYYATKDVTKIKGFRG